MALTILAGPVEEFAKAALVIAIVILLKPRYLLSGLLIGFCVGAGFTLFESIQYCSGSYIQTILEGLAGEEADIAAAYDEAGSAAVGTGVIRSVTDLFIGHHFWAGIYGGALVLCKKDETLSGKQIFDKNVLTVFFLCVALHTAFAGFYAFTYTVSAQLTIMIWSPSPNSSTWTPGTVMPPFDSASVSMTPGPPACVTMAKRVMGFAL